MYILRVCNRREVYIKYTNLVILHPCSPVLHGIRPSICLRHYCASMHAWHIARPWQNHSRTSFSTLSPDSFYLLHPCSRVLHGIRPSLYIAAPLHPCSRGIRPPWMAEMSELQELFPTVHPVHRRSSASMQPRHTVHPVIAAPLHPCSRGIQYILGICSCVALPPTSL